MLIDKDLQSIQEMRELVQKAKKAQTEYRTYDQKKVDLICRNLAEAGYAAASRLAQIAYEETGYGNPADKKRKNEFATRRVCESIKNLKTAGVIQEDHEKGIIEIAEPMGVVAALIPSTNPTSTLMFKTIISLKGRNAIVATPHPKSTKSTIEAAHILSQSAEASGAPQGLVQCLSNPTIEATNALMTHKDIALILATGSAQMVKAAYSSGKPAYGVGPGNVPAYIERTADIRKAVADIVTGKLFDNGVLCSAEASVVVDSSIKNIVMEEFKKIDCYFIEGDDKLKLSRFMFKESGDLNSEIVGKPAVYIAQRAGISIPPATKVLIVEIQGVGKNFPLSHEKLSPVLSFFTVENWREGCERCIELLEFGGIGHTMVIHSKDEEIIMKFALEKPAFRILVNTVGALGAIGYTNELLPSLTLGPGTFGGSIISENVSAKHLINVKRLAFETRPMNQPDSHGKNRYLPILSSFQTATQKLEPKQPISEDDRLTAGEATINRSWLDEIEKKIYQNAENNRMSPVLNPEQNEKPKSGILGSGITEEEVEQIIREFSNK